MISLVLRTKVISIMKFVISTLVFFLVAVDVTSTWKSPQTPTAVAFEGNLELPEESPYSSEEEGPLEAFFCPDQCVCSLQEKIIDCSSLGLDYVPKIPKQTSRL